MIFSILGWRVLSRSDVSVVLVRFTVFLITQQFVSQIRYGVRNRVILHSLKIFKGSTRLWGAGCVQLYHYFTVRVQYTVSLKVNTD